MTRAARPVRLFVAVYPAPDLAERALAALDRLPLPEHRRVPAAQVHLTLHFVGPADAREIGAIADSIAHACAGLGAFELAPARLVTLPDRGPPSLVALELDPHPGALELHERLVRRLARRPAERPGRAYRPHLTLCRFAPGVRADRVNEPAELAAMTVDRVRLMRSVLRPQGAEHAEVASFPLAAG